jgi:hypothetical protein
MGLYTLSAIERQVIYRKYRKKGLSHEEAVDSIKVFNDNLYKIKLKLVKQNKSQKDIDTRFKAEFEKLCRSIDYD